MKTDILEKIKKIWFEYEREVASDMKDEDEFDIDEWDAQTKQQLLEIKTLRDFINFLDGEGFDEYEAYEQVIEIMEELILKTK